MKGTKYTKNCNIMEICAKDLHDDDEDRRVKNGIIEGFAAGFDNTDGQGDIIRRGAFARSIDKVKAGRVGLMVRHIKSGGDVMETIGEIVFAEEREKGLFITAELNDSQIAQETRSKILQSPNLFGMSVGFMMVSGGSTPIMDGDDFTGLEFTEVKLMEVTVTVIPANDETDAAAKTNDNDWLSSTLKEMRKDVDSLKDKVKSLTRDPNDTLEKSSEPVNQTALDEKAKRDREILILEMECNHGRTNQEVEGS